jgi:hypothetical protein
VLKLAFQLAKRPLAVLWGTKRTLAKLGLDHSIAVPWFPFRISDTARERRFALAVRTVPEDGDVPA